VKMHLPTRHCKHVSTAGGRDVACNVSHAHNFEEDNTMVEELEKEYAVLKDKVRELREYL
jgi:acetylornithine/succinyldiaminopimelate/putrescine aminotransferase